MNEVYPDNTPVVQQQPPRSRFKSITSTAVVFLAAPLLALFLTAFVFQSYQVDGPSMQETLHNNDRLIVLKLSRTIARVTHRTYMPKRYDIIIFNSESILDPLSGKSKQLIKRVIALPGERVIVQDNKVVVINKEHPEGFSPDSGQDYQKNLPPVSPGDVNLTVPDDQVFVMGDNRINSEDSRYFGPVPAHDIVGRLVLRIFPIGNAKSF